MRSRYFVVNADLEKLSERARRAQAGAAPEWVGGVLVLEKPRRLYLRYLPNRSDLPGVHEAFATDLLRARAEAVAEGRRCVGYFGSRPGKDASPHPGALERASFNDLLLVHAVGSRMHRLWRVAERSGARYARREELVAS